MANPIQKDFIIEGHEENDDHSGIPMIITIRQATEEENIRHEDYMAADKIYFSNFIKLGRKSERCYFLRFYEPPDLFKYPIDDKLHRFKYALKSAEIEILREEIILTLAACNITSCDHKNEPILKFLNGHIDLHNCESGWFDKIEFLKEDIHKKIIEMNPTWSNAFEKMSDALIKENHLEEQLDNYDDLLSESAFVKSKSNIHSLLEKINQDELKGIGTIETSNPNINEPEDLEDLRQPANGLYLCFPNNSLKGGTGYIGVLDNGKYEIRVVAERDRKKYRDTDIDGIANTLHKAIVWWRQSGEFSRQEYYEYCREHHKYSADQDDGQIQADGEAFMAEMRSQGLTDEDDGYGGDGSEDGSEDDSDDFDVDDSDDETF